MLVVCHWNDSTVRLRWARRGCPHLAPEIGVSGLVDDGGAMQGHFADTPLALPAWVDCSCRRSGKATALRSFGVDDAVGRKTRGTGQAAGA